jgi:hypothetical protein
MSEQLDEPLDARIPEAFVVPEPVVGALERPWVDAAVVDASAHGAFHKAGPLEGLYVLRRRGERHPARSWRNVNALVECTTRSGLYRYRVGRGRRPGRPLREFTWADETLVN